MIRLQKVNPDRLLKMLQPGRGDGLMELLDKALVWGPPGLRLRECLHGIGTKELQLWDVQSTPYRMVSPIYAGGWARVGAAVTELNDSCKAIGLVALALVPGAPCGTARSLSEQLHRWGEAIGRPRVLAGSKRPGMARLAARCGWGPVQQPIEMPPGFRAFEYPAP